MAKTKAPLPLGCVREGLENDNFVWCEAQQQLLRIDPLHLILGQNGRPKEGKEGARDSNRQQANDHYDGFKRSEAQELPWQTTHPS